MYIIGVDTSGYTSSLAVVNFEGKVVINEVKMLEVKPGKRGLRQSKAVFQHMQNLPLLVEKAGNRISLKKSLAVAASTKPRPSANSYMPVFKAGESYAKSFAGLLGIPFFPTTHQEGHLWASLFSLKVKPVHFLALHLSGGTTELLEVYNEDCNLKIIRIGGTSDLPLGQLIDRIGVKMGFPFPCGPFLEKEASKSAAPLEVPVSFDGCWLSFSGPLTHAEKLLAAGGETKDLARGIEISAAKSLLGVINNAVKKTGLNQVVITGGVASNTFIRNYLLDNINKGELIFTDPEYSRDNAVGIAYYGWRQHLTK